MTPRWPSVFARRHLCASGEHTLHKGSEKGFVTIEFVMGVAFLLLPVTLLVLVLPTWSERQSVARVAAREAAREYVLSADIEQARESAFRIADNSNINRDSFDIAFDGDPAERGGSVRAIVEIKVPVTAIPILGANSDAFTLTETHTEIVDLYRSAR